MRCSCGIDTPYPAIIGWQPGFVGSDPANSIPDMVLWNCLKGSTHAIPLPETTEEQREAADLAEMATRPTSPEMLMSPAGGK